MVLFIIEGSDGTGKSTLITHLERSIRNAFPHDTLELWNAGPPSKPPLAEYEEPLYHYRPNTGRHIICDRWHLGEWVYPRILNRSTTADDAKMWHIDAFLASRGAVFVHADLDPQIVMNNIIARGDDIVQATQIAEIVSAYHQVIVNGVFHNELWRYDYTDEDPVSYAQELIAYAEHVDKNAQRLARFVTYVGRPDPNFILFGDVRHQLRDIAPFADPLLTINYGPALGPAAGTSGHFLLSHLPRVIKSLTGVANACDVDDPEELWNSLGRPKTIALGRNAYDAVRKFNPKTGAVPHPQYIRRFFHSHGSEYGELIRSVCLMPRNELSWRPTTTEPKAA